MNLFGIIDVVELFRVALLYIWGLLDLHALRLDLPEVEHWIVILNFLSQRSIHRLLFLFTASTETSHRVLVQKYRRFEAEVWTKFESPHF